MQKQLRISRRLYAYPGLLPSEYVFSAMVGMARCAVPARVVAGGTHVPATPAYEAVAPLHAARTSQRDVPTPLNTYPQRGRGMGWAAEFMDRVRLSLDRRVHV